MIRIVCLYICLFVLSTAFAQEKLVVKGKANDWYVIHKVSGKENLQSISNVYGISINKLASYNHLSATAKIKNDIALHIPITKDQILQKKTSSGAPLYHVIAKGDNLYRVSKVYGNVPVPKLKEWNNMKNDVVKNGQTLIIGYLVNAPVETETVVKHEEPKIEPQIISPIPNTSSAVAPPIDPYVKGKPSKLNESTGTFYEVEKAKKNADDTKLKTSTPEQKPVIPARDYDAEAKQKLATMQVEYDAEKKKEVVNNQPIVNTDYTPKEGDEGYFAAAYVDHSKEKAQQFHSGDAAIFKTISGWTDRKYYVLMNDVAPKTIVRITASNRKTVCAMVLGPLQELKDDNGLSLRISNAAAAALGMTDTKFPVTITYFE